MAKRKALRPAPESLALQGIDLAIAADKAKVSKDAKHLLHALLLAVEGLAELKEELQTINRQLAARKRR
jgi:hypothetical protein